MSTKCATRTTRSSCTSRRVRIVIRSGGIKIKVIYISSYETSQVCMTLGMNPRNRANRSARRLVHNLLLRLIPDCVPPLFFFVCFFLNFFY